MYRKICIIGLGSLGSAIAKNLSYLKQIESLILIDYDMVEEKNIENTVYDEKDIGKTKVEALSEKIKNKNIIIYNEKFIEGITKIPDSDLVLDCRDFTYERKDFIDARLFISYRSLMIDCRKNIKFENQYQGKYMERLTKSELNLIANKVAILVENGTLDMLVNKKRVTEIKIDDMSEKICEDLSKDNIDIIYENNSFDEKLVNLRDNYPDIVNANKNKTIDLYLGDKEISALNQTVPINSLRTINDIISVFSSFLTMYPVQYNYYLVKIQNNNDKFCVTLLPDTGAA